MENLLALTNKRMIQYLNELMDFLVDSQQFGTGFQYQIFIISIASWLFSKKT